MGLWVKLSSTPNHASRLLSGTEQSREKLLCEVSVLLINKISSSSLPAEAMDEVTTPGSKQHNLQAVELTQRSQTAV